MAKINHDRPDTTTQAGRLRWARLYAGFLSARSAANNFGWNENTYKSHEQGIRQAEGLKQKHAEKYARAFQVSLPWLMSGQGDPLKKGQDLSPEDLAIAEKLLEALGRR